MKLSLCKENININNITDKFKFLCSNNIIKIVV